ncbi:MAG: aconitase, partial [Halanaerobium sp. MSAO_Bac5]
MEEKFQNLIDVLDDYKNRAIKRREVHGLEARPLSAEEVETLFSALSLEGLENKSYKIFIEKRMDKLILDLITNQVRRGTFPSSHAKAEGLSKLIKKAKLTEKENPYLSSDRALELLAEMKGGAAAARLIDLFAKEIYKE